MEKTKQKLVKLKKRKKTKKREFLDGEIESTLKFLNLTNKDKNK